MSLAGEHAAVYRRCSEDRNDQASVSEQEELGAARCETEGWQPHWYEDNDRSASRYAKKDRDDWPRLIAGLRAGEFTIVWLWESSRGDRKLYEWAGFLEDCRDRGVRIYVETHQRLYDPRIPRDWKTLAEDGVANAYASDETSQRVRRTLASNARRGIPNGKVHYGYIRLYDPKNGRYASQRPEPPECDIAAEIITRIASSEPLYAIVQDLTARQIPAPHGHAWCTATLRYMARNPAYAGYRRKADGELRESWPGIVSLDTHRAAVAVLADPARSTLAARPVRPGRQKHLLSYLATCDACGSILQVVKNKYKQPRYQCRAHGCVGVAPEWLDGLISGLVCARLSQPDAARVFRSDSEEAARHRGEAARLRLQLDEWLNSDVSPKAYAVKEAQLLPQIERAEQAAEALEMPLLLRKMLTASDVRGTWDELGVAAQRAVLRALMDISVARAADQTRASRTDPGRIIIKWRHSD